MRRVWVGETGRAEDIEADQHLYMCYRPELAGLDASQDLLRSMVEYVIVILDEMAAGPHARVGPASPVRRSVEVAGFSTMTWAPASNESMHSRKWEVGGVVTWTMSGGPCPAWLR